GPLEVVRVVATTDRIQRVVRRHVHHGEGARRDDVILTVRGDRVHRRLVPLDYFIGAGRRSEDDGPKTESSETSNAVPHGSFPPLVPRTVVSGGGHGGWRSA